MCLIGIFRNYNPDSLGSTFPLCDFFCSLAGLISTPTPGVGESLTKSRSWLVFLRVDPFDVGNPPFDQCARDLCLKARSELR